jgi:hypothetical protein
MLVPLAVLSYQLEWSRLCGWEQVTSLNTRTADGRQLKHVAMGT